MRRLPAVALQAGDITRLRKIEMRPAGWVIISYHFLLNLPYQSSEKLISRTVPYNEGELLQALRQGSEHAFTILYKHYSVPLYYNILSLVKDECTAEELVQDVFSKIWKQKASINIEKSFSGYLFVTARNRVYDFFQQVNRDKVLHAKIMTMASEGYDHIEQALFAKENADLLRKAIDTLPPQRRRAFELCKLEGLTYRQASEEMGISLSTIKDHMVNAFDAIRLYISGHVGVAGMLAFYCICNLP